MAKFFLIALFCVLCFGCDSSTKESLYQQGVDRFNSGDPSAAIVFLKNALEKDGNYGEARFQLGKAYAALGKFDLAEKEFTKVLTQNPLHEEVLLELAKVNNSAGKGEQAFSYAEKYLAKHPGSAAALEVLGVSFAVRKKFDESLKHLKMALQQEPARTSARLEIASVFLALEKVDLAKQELRTVLQTEPRNMKALFTLAALEKEVGNKAEAVSIYQKILQLDPQQSTAKYKLGLLQVEDRKLDRANETADDLIQKFPKKGDGYRLKGLVAFYRKQYDEAIASLQQSVKLSPSLEGYHFLGLSYYSKGEFENALSQFRLILDRVPSARKARLMLARTLMTQKRTDDAITELKKILTESETDAYAHSMLGSAYISQGLFEEGMRELDRATKLDPKMADAHLKKGAFYLSRGRNAEGETELATAVQAAPDALNSRMLLASYHRRQGRHAKALSVLQEGLRGGKQDALLHNAIAALRFAAGQKAEGVRSLEQAKQADPALPATYQNLAGFYAGTGDYPKAISELTSLLGVSPNNLNALLGLAALSDLRGSDGDASNYYQKAIATKAPEAFLALAAFHQKKGAADKALEVLDQAIKADPRVVAPHEAKGMLLVQQKEYRKAIKAFDEVELLDKDKGIALKVGVYVAMKDAVQAIEQAGRLASKNPGSSQGHLLLSSVYRGLNDFSSAVNEANKAVKADARSPEARLALGNLYLDKKDYSNAQAAYREALRLKPDWIPAQFAASSVQDMVGKKKEAAEGYRAIIARSDNYVPALNNLALLSADGYGNKEEALRLAVAAFKLQPGSAEVMDTLGYALVKNGRGTDAVKVMERAAALLPKNPTVSYHLALAYQLSGDRAKTEQALKKALSQGEFPENRAAQVMLAQMKK